MKNLKNVLLTGMILFTVAATATNEKITSDGNVTITHEDEKVEVSVLNMQNETYQLFIYSEDGTLVLKVN